MKYIVAISMLLFVWIDSAISQIQYNGLEVAVDECENCNSSSEYQVVQAGRVFATNTIISDFGPRSSHTYWHECKQLKDQLRYRDAVILKTADQDKGTQSYPDSP